MKIILLPAFCLLSLFAQAQKEFTYVSDKKFKTSDELLNYAFLPNEMEDTKAASKKSLVAGAVVFQLTAGYLKVKDGETESSYNVNAINPEKYGFKADLMNARNPTEQGHLKVILTDRGYVDALVFKKDRKSPEVVYYQASPNPKTLARDTKYFTDKTDVNMSNLIYLFPKVVRPYFKQEGEQARIYPKDSVEFRFYEKEVQNGKKTVKEKFVAYKWLKPGKDAESEPEMKEITYTIKKINEIEIGQQKGFEFELKDGGKPMTLLLSPTMLLEAIEWSGSIYWLRDKREQGEPEAKPSPAPKTGK